MEDHNEWAKYYGIYIYDSDNPDAFWELLGNVPVTEYGLIDEDFLAWDKGTDRKLIWDWMEDAFEISIGFRYFG